MSLSLAQIDQGIDALLQNAKALIAESRLLYDAKAVARAYTLSHLGREELSRVVMLEATALRILAERPVEWRKLMKRLRDHKAKLALEDAESAMFLIGSGVHPAEKMALQIAGQTTSMRNDWKNASIYVNFEHGTFVLPTNQISDRKAERNVLLAELRLNSFMRRRAMSLPFSKREVGSLRDMPDIDALMKADPDALLAATSKLVALIEAKINSQEFGQ